MYEFGLLHVKIRFDMARRHVSRENKKWCATFRGFADPGDRVGETGSGMHADKRQLAGRLCIGVGHACSVAFMARGNEFDARFDQRMRNPEIGRAEQAKTAAGSKCREIL